MVTMAHKKQRLVALVMVLVAACGGSSAAMSDNPESVSPSADSPASTAAGADTSVSKAPKQTETTGTDAPPGSTVQEASVATPPPSPDVSEPQQEFGPEVPPTPIERLDHFRWTFAAAVTDDRRQVVLISSDGAYDEGSFECDVRVTRLNRTAILTLVGMADGREYIDLALGRGLDLVSDRRDPDDDEAPTESEIYRANLAFCPGAEAFWDGLGVEGELLNSSDIVRRNEQTTKRLDLTTIPAIRGFLSPLGPPGQTTYDRYTLFITTAGGWINAMEMSAKVSAKAIAELADSEPGPSGRLDVKIDIIDAGDAGIEVDDPQPTG